MHTEPTTTFFAAALLAAFSLIPLALTSDQDPKKGRQPDAAVSIPRSDTGGIAREKELIRRAKESGNAHVVFIGDSITQGWEGEGRAFWAANFEKLPALNLGNSGDRTEHVLHRLNEAPITRLHPKHVVLMIGTNNLGHGSSNADETLQGVKAIVSKLVEQCDATIHVLEIFPRGERITPMRGDIAQINQALRAHVDEHNKATKQGKARLAIHAIGDRFVRADGTIDAAVMPDFLHLSKDGYRIWGEALLPLVSK